MRINLRSPGDARERPGAMVTWGSPGLRIPLDHRGSQGVPWGPRAWDAQGPPGDATGITMPPL